MTLMTKENIWGGIKIFHIVLSSGHKELKTFLIFDLKFSNLMLTSQSKDKQLVKSPEGWTVGGWDREREGGWTSTVTSAALNTTDPDV